MTNVTRYSRPSDLSEALNLLRQPDAVVIGGGTEVNARDAGEAIAVVDLQSVGIDGVELCDANTLRIGATTTLQSVADHTDVPVALRGAARREMPSTLRSQATIGGAICGRRGDSEVVAALLLHDAVATVSGLDGQAEIALDRLLAERSRLEQRILTAVTIDPSGDTTSARTGRTRADRPIVAVYGRKRANGAHRIVVTGFADAPLVIDGADDVKETLSRTAARADFRGSREYRRVLAEVLAGRILEELGR